MLFRLILYAIVGYIIWKVIQAFSAPRQRGPRSPHSPAPPPSSTKPFPTKFTDVKDAEFEEIPPKKGE